MLGAVASALAAVKPAEAGRKSLSDAQKALSKKDTSAARRSLNDAASSFKEADSRLSSPLGLAGSYFPLLGRQIRTARALASAGEMATRAGKAALAMTGASEIKFESGRLDPASLSNARLGIRLVNPWLWVARFRIEQSPDSFLLPQLRDARKAALREATRISESARKASAGIEIVGDMLGAKQPRRYLIAFGNLSEIRGTGGFYGYYAVVEARDGKIAFLRDTGRPIEQLPPLADQKVTAPEWVTNAYGRYNALTSWQNVNTPTDFPAVASVVLQGVQPSYGDLDGVIQIDPNGLEALLALTGPVTVKPWPEPITAANVAQIMQHDAYVRFADQGRVRVAFLGDVVSEVFSRLSDIDAKLSDSAVGGFGKAVSSGHLQVYATRPNEQKAMRKVGAAHEVRARSSGASDVLGVVSQNATGNKIDWFMRRKWDYRVKLNPATGEATSTLRLDIENRAPASGLPDYIIGTALKDEGLEPGTTRQILELIRPGNDVLDSLSRDGEDLSVINAPEDNLTAYHYSPLDIVAGDTAHIKASFTVPGGLTGTGLNRAYSLTLLSQPVAFNDSYSVTVEVPDGWKLDGPSTMRGEMDSDVHLNLKLSQTRRTWFVNRVFVRPWNLARDLLR